MLRSFHERGETQKEDDNSSERRAERAQMTVMMGEVSSGRQVLEGAPLAPGLKSVVVGQSVRSLWTITCSFRMCGQHGEGPQQDRQG